MRYRKIVSIWVSMVIVWIGWSVFALTPKEQKWVITLKAASIDYLSPSWFTPFGLWQTPERLAYWTSLLPEQDRDVGFYIVMPTLWLISPVIVVPEDSADYATMQAGGEIDINTYLVDGVMHYPWTPMPDQEGNIVIFWHSNFYSNKPWRYKTIFADIMNLDAIPTDEIWLYYKQPSGQYELYKYRVEKSYETTPTDVDILQPQWWKELTVFACTNWLAGRRILRAKQLPDEEILVHSSIKARLRDLVERLEKMPESTQSQIVSRVLQEIEATRLNGAPLFTKRERQMRLYVLRRIEMTLTK